METLFYYETPLGKMAICENGTAITHISLTQTSSLKEERMIRQTPLIRQAILQLRQYFAGSRKHFELPLCARGTEFQQSVWEVLRTIPYGQTRSYKEVAVALGNPNAARAVGMANHNNPITIVIPCHRVIGSDGSLVGFGPGIDVKKRLLALEKEKI